MFPAFFKIILDRKLSPAYNLSTKAVSLLSAVSMIKRKKVLLIFCGGTTLFPEKVATPSVRRPEEIKPWMKNIEEVRMIADLDPCFVFGGEAAEVGARQWLKIAEAIRRNYKKYDGFIITHGVETLSYTAAALSFMLSNLGKPVVLTGSPIPSREEASAEVLQAIFRNFRGLGVKANLINACQVAISDLAGLLVIFGSRIFSPTQTENLADYKAGSDEAEGSKILGKIDFGLTLYRELRKRHSRRPQIKAKIDSKVSVFDFHPGLDLNLLKNVLASQPHGLIIKTQSASFFPETVYIWLKKAMKKGLPVVIHVSAGLKPPKDEDFIYVDNMNLAATVVKLMWILGQTKRPSQVKKMMQTDFCGEIIKKGEK